MPQFPSLSSLLPPNTRLPTSTTAAAAAATALALLIYHTTTHKPSTPSKLLPSPRTTLLPTLFPSEIAALPYPPDALPGGRWVESPYGAIRVYEWGPEDGRRVLLVHGISTPCLALGSVAEGLVGMGCRVMLIDLFGRGYSDSPADLPHDTRLYTTEILLAITSSLLPWTGSGVKFSLVGYSLGGGICAAFTAYFPQMVESLVLLAPSGLIREKHMSLLTKVMHAADLIPDRVVSYFVERRMRSFQIPPPATKPAPSEEKEEGGKATPESAAAAEAPTQATPATVPMSRKYPALSLAGAIGFQLSYHRGYLPAFISSIRFAPISGQEEDWERLARSVETLQNGKVLIIAGEKDDVVIPAELREDAGKVLGEDGVEWQETPGKGHEFPIVAGDEVADRIGRFWGLERDISF